MVREQIPKLSKSRFLAGLQCHKRLYLECFHPDLADPVDVGQQAILDAGTRVGELARNIYANGLHISEPYFQHEDAVVSTQAAISDRSIASVYEAAFLYDDIRIRADILIRTGDDLFDLIEVKSTTSVKEEHLPDLGVQLYVLRGCGIPVRRACLAHLNKEYVYQGGDYDLGQLFSAEDITDEVQPLLVDIPSISDEMRLHLSNPEPPDIKARKQCSHPYTCPFYGHCHTDEPEHSITQLPRASQKLLDLLEEEGIEDIRGIPADFPGLNATQQRVRDCVVNSRVHVDLELARALSQLEYPIHFLDFETFNPALPVYIGTRPYQVIPFQWSNHILDRNGRLMHQEFLNEGSGDPREPFARGLLETLGTTGTIITYSNFEATRIRELAQALPELASDLLALMDGRIVDLLQLIRRYCYHPEFHGSFSLKSVLPALVPDLDYSDLEICEGDQASTAYAEMILPETSTDRRGSLRKALLAYCKRDTEAMVRLFQTLRAGLTV